MERELQRIIEILVMNTLRQMDYKYGFEKIIDIQLYDYDDVHQVRVTFFDKRHNKKGLLISV